MRKIAVGLGAVLVVAGVAAAALPWYLGIETEKHIQAAIKEPHGANSAFSLRLVQYRRGWAHSVAVHRIGLKADPDVYFDIRHDIDHLPDPRGELVHVRSTPRWPEQVQAAADYYFGKQPAMTVDTVVDFDRNVDVSIASPAFSRRLRTQPEVKLTWGGAQGALRFAGASKMKLELSMPRLAFEGGGASADLTATRLGGDWSMAGSQLDWHGDTRLTIGQLSMESPGGGGTLKGIETTMLQRNQGATILVGYTVKVREGTATGAGVDPQSFTDAVLDVEFDRLSKRALSQYFDDLAGAEQSGVSRQAQTRLAGRLWLALMNELLKGSPEMRVKQLGVKTANGTLSGSAVLGFDGAGFTQFSSAFELMTRTRFSASAEASATLLRAWMTKDARAAAVNVLAQQGTFPDEAQVKSLSEQLVQQQLAALEAAGLLKPEGGNFVLRAEMTDGKLTLNGNPADQFLGPMLAPPAAPIPALAPGGRDV
jgi:uncharacterized protein YdgA (DUF945 family)